MCQVFAGDLQANATVTINRLGLSALYVLVLLLSSSASAAVLLFSALIYCRSHSSGFFVGPTRHGVPEGGSVILPCHVHNPPHTPLKVEWRRKDQEAGVILLYGGGKSGEGVQQQEHQGRARLFTDQIPQGNFSLLLERVRAEDQGEYTCKVYSGEDEVFSSDTLVVELRLLGPVFGLQMCLVFWPNLLMALAFLVWGVCEGSLGEMMGCCALYLLRPLMLLWTAPYHTSFSGRVRTWIQDAYFTEYTLFSAVFYSVLFKSAWDKSLNYAEFEGVLIVIIFIIVLLCNIAFIVYLVVRFLGKLSERVTAVFVVLARVSFDVLPSLQFILLFYAFGSARGGFFIVAILPVFLTATRYNWERTCGEKMGCSALLRRSVWLTVMMMVNTLMLYFYIIALEKQKDRYGWASMIAFLQCLWALVNLTYSFTCELRRLTSVYVFGSVVVVLLNSTALTTELTLKTLSGEGVLGDLRVVSFSSDFLFTFPLLILLIFQPWIKPCRSPPQTSERHEETSEVPNHTTTESHELDRLMKAEDVEDGLSEEVT